MTRTSFVLTLAMLVVAALAVPALSAKIEGAQRGGTPLSATLTGDAEVPGPGDPDGTGSAMITLNSGKQQVCWDLAFENVDDPTAAHIHVGSADVAGPVVVPLDPMAPGCADADRDLIKDIRANPSGYYVNVHSEEFPAGAIRGQLERP